MNTTVGKVMLVFFGIFFLYILYTCLCSIKLRCCQRRDPSEDFDSDEENVVIIKQKRLRFADEVQENEEVEELKGILKK